MINSDLLFTRFVPEGCLEGCNRGHSVQQGKTPYCQSHDLWGEGTHTAWAVVRQHLVENHGQVRPAPSYIETGEIIQTLGC